ncbi:MAG TPA: sigma-54 dependent transcriptional regulator, partial [Pyrinomonadaceae bacterium]|nr:sigma-54 dependent transcriptional regulator [Pyrinomonadaceae bacterium]
NKMKEDAARVLIIDDETNLRESLAELAGSEGFRASQAANGEEAVRVLRSGAEKPDVVFLDMRMPKLDGLGVLRLIQEERLTDAPVVVISAFGDSSKMIEAMRLGAYDYITKPLDLDEIVAILHRAAEQRRLNREAEAQRPPDSANESTKGAASPERQFEMLGVSRAMRDIFKQIGRIAATDATLLIMGESGTGKELVARAVHQHSARSQRPFVAVNCGALPENLIEAELFGHERGAFTGAERQKKGRFELAHTGTLFLDEVGELSPAAQVKLLRVVEVRRFERVGGTESIGVDVRVIAATNRDLKQEVEEKRFREDLYYRLNVIEVRLPPLRERLADVPQLAESFLERAVSRHALKTKTLSSVSLRELLAYDFPGNVRELENMIERAAVTSSGEVILPEHLFGNDHAPAAASSQNAVSKLFELPFHQAVAALERELIRRALEASGGNRAEAARLLGINRRLLYSKIEEHRIT